MTIASFSTHPTLAARKIMNHSYIHAKVSGNLLSIYPCEPVERYTIIASNSCTDRIAMQVNIKGQNTTMYMNTVDNILHTNPGSSECALDNEIPFQISEQTFLYHYATGAVQNLTLDYSLDLLTLNFSDLATALGLNQTVIHELSMYSLKDFTEQFSLNDVMGSWSKYEQVFQQLDAGIEYGNANDHALGMISHITQIGDTAWLKGAISINWYKAWVLTCCLLVTLSFIWRLILCCTRARSYSSNPITRIKRYMINERDKRESQSVTVDLNVTQEPCAVDLESGRLMSDECQNVEDKAMRSDIISAEKQRLVKTSQLIALETSVKARKLIKR
jgi:hypothetical protein